MTELSSHTVGLTWQAGLRLALLGVVVGAAVGAGTGMWWMMGVLGGTVPRRREAVRSQVALSRQGGWPIPAPTSTEPTTTTLAMLTRRG